MSNWNNIFCEKKRQNRFSLCVCVFHMGNGKLAMKRTTHLDDKRKRFTVCQMDWMHHPRLNCRATESNETEQNDDVMKDGGWNDERKENRKRLTNANGNKSEFSKGLNYVAADINFYMRFAFTLPLFFCYKVIACDSHISPTRII